MYRTHLINFGRDVYVGDSLAKARESAVASGFEVVIYADQMAILAWSPIQGWRGLQG
jgi:hypothetical protein